MLIEYKREKKKVKDLNVHTARHGLCTYKIFLFSFFFFFIWSISLYIDRFCWQDYNTADRGCLGVSVYNPSNTEQYVYILYSIYPEFRIRNCRFRLGKGAESL